MTEHFEFTESYKLSLHIILYVLLIDEVGVEKQKVTLVLCEEWTY